MQIRIKTYHNIIHSFVSQASKKELGSKISFMTKANKRQIFFFMKDFFGIEPKKVNIVSLKKSTFKKAHVALSKKDQSTFYEMLGSTITKK